MTTARALVPGRRARGSLKDMQPAELLRALLSNDEIADAMVLSPTTAKTHVSRAMIKLGARDRAQLVVFAYQSGLVSPRDSVPRR